jgi:hypothetical protein
VEREDLVIEVASVGFGEREREAAMVMFPKWRVRL